MKLTVISDYINNMGGTAISVTLWQRISEWSWQNVGGIHYAGCLCSCHEELRTAEVFEVKKMQELVLEVGGYVSNKTWQKKEQSLTSDIEEQLDGGTSPIQILKATTETVPFVATDRMTTERRLYLQFVYPESLDCILDFVFTSVMLKEVKM